VFIGDVDRVALSGATAREMPTADCVPLSRSARARIAHVTANTKVVALTSLVDADHFIYIVDVEKRFICQQTGSLRVRPRVSACERERLREVSRSLGVPSLLTLARATTPIDA